MSEPTGRQSIIDVDKDEESDEERRNRERALDDTLEDSFPASDPLATDPNPDTHGADDRDPSVEPVDGEPQSRRRNSS
jgi:hypothetical protein